VRAATLPISPARWSTTGSKQRCPVGSLRILVSPQIGRFPTSIFFGGGFAIYAGLTLENKTRCVSLPPAYSESLHHATRRLPTIDSKGEHRFHQRLFADSWWRLLFFGSYEFVCEGKRTCRLQQLGGYMRIKYPHSCPYLIWELDLWTTENLSRWSMQSSWARKP
jgi:hypothetical protein